VTLQIAEGGRIALLLRKEMLVDAEHARTGSAATLGELALEVIVEPALDSGAADLFALA